MTQISSFFDANMVNGVPDREYDATSWANYFKGLIGNGVSITPSSNLQVVAGTGLNVILSPGIAYINGYYYNNTECLSISLNLANATYPRITSIILELNLNNRSIMARAIDGVANNNPVPVSLIKTAGVYQLQLATIYIPAGATSVGKITDTRSNKEVCGWVNMLVPGLDNNIINSSTLKGTTTNDGTLYGGAINEAELFNCEISNPAITGGTIKNVSGIGGAFLNPLLKGTITNDGTLYGGAINEAELFNCKISNPAITGGTIKNVSGIGGAFLNPLLKGTITNTGTIYGGEATELNIVNSSLTNCSFNESDLENSTTKNSTVSESVIIDSKLQGTTTNEGIISGGSITDAKIDNANIQTPSVSGGSITEAEVNSCSFIKCSFDGGTVKNVNLTGDIKVNGNLNLVELLKQLNLNSENLGNTGYIIINGLYLQWGTWEITGTNGGGAIQKSLPLTFPHGYVFGGGNASTINAQTVGYIADINVSVQPISNSVIQIVAQNVINQNGDVLAGSWFVLGY